MKSIFSIILLLSTFVLLESCEKDTPAPVIEPHTDNYLAADFTGIEGIVLGLETVDIAVARAFISYTETDINYLFISQQIGNAGCLACKEDAHTDAGKVQMSPTGELTFTPTDTLKTAYSGIFENQSANMSVTFPFATNQAVPFTLTAPLMTEVEEGSF